MKQIQCYNMSGFFVPDILYTIASILSKIGLVFCLHSDYFWDSLHVHIYEVCPVKIFLICIFQPIFLNKQIYILILNLSLIYNLIVPTYIISIIIVCDIFVLYTILPIFERMYINQHLSIFSYSKCGNISVVIGAVSIPQIYSQLLYSS